MVTNRKPSGKAASIPKGLLYSGITGLTLTIIGASIIAYLVNTEMIAPSSIGYAVMVLLILSSLSSSFVAWKKVKHQKIMVCISAGFVYYTILLSITALFFGGQFSALFETALLVLCGSFLAIILTSGNKKRNTFGKAKNAYR